MRPMVSSARRTVPVARRCLLTVGAHVRRGFFDATKGDATPIAQEALRRIGQIYEIEREISGRAPHERLAVRQTRSRPIVEDLRQWLDEKRRRMFTGSPTLGPINYALNHWAGLVRFLEDGRIDLDNNPVERSMRPVALQRKNALFAGHELGAENWAAIASLVETCKLLGIDPNAYLADVLARIVTRRDDDTIDDLLPGQLGRYQGRRNDVRNERHRQGGLSKRRSKPVTSKKIAAASKWRLHPHALSGEESPLTHRPLTRPADMRSRWKHRLQQSPFRACQICWQRQSGSRMKGASGISPNPRSSEVFGETPESMIGQAVKLTC